MDVEVIRSVPLSTRVQPDFWVWHFEKNDVFTVRSAYRLLVKTKLEREAWLEGRPSSSSSQAEGKKWTTQLNVFLWRLARQSLPTGDVLSHRHIADNGNCALCGEADSWRHSLISCTMARCVWSLVD